jgi:hypothetical protein
MKGVPPPILLAAVVIGSSVILSDPIFQWSRNFADGG